VHLTSNVVECTNLETCPSRSLTAGVCAIRLPLLEGIGPNRRARLMAPRRPRRHGSKQLFQSPQQLHQTPLRALASNPDCFKSQTEGRSAWAALTCDIQKGKERKDRNSQDIRSK